MNKQIEEQINNILQKVHDDACKKGHVKELGFSSRATQELQDLITKSNEEAVRGFWKEFHKNRTSSNPINANLLLEQYITQKESNE